MHRDHVPTLPPYPHLCLIGSTPLTPIQGFILPRPRRSHALKSASVLSSSHHFSSKDVQVLTLQGHPEINTRIIEHIVAARGPSGSGVIGAATAEEALVRAKPEDDGVTVIGRKVLEVLDVI